MINFRYHLVSLIAVFLALTIGIALGATVIDRLTVDRLQSRIDSLERNRKATDDTNKQLNKALDRNTSYLDGVETAAVQGRLIGHSVLVFAERGVDSARVKALVETLQSAEADAPAIVWLEPKWKLADPASREALATAVPATAVGSANEARRVAFVALAKRLTHPPATAASSASASTTTSVTGPTDVLDALRRAGFVSIERAGAGGRDDLTTFGSEAASAVLVVGDDARDPAPQLATSFGDAFATSGTSLIVGEVDPSNADASTRGDAVASVRSNADLRTLVSTVDDVDLSAGRIDVVLALADLDKGQVGHYGYGSGAEAPMPSL
jgi:hypothetical protein